MHRTLARHSLALVLVFAFACQRTPPAPAPPNPAPHAAAALACRVDADCTLRDDQCRKKSCVVACADHTCVLKEYEPSYDLARLPYAAACRDRGDCASGSCIVVYARDARSAAFFPEFGCSDTMTYDARCYIGTEPLVGCHWYLEGGRCVFRCLDVVPN